MDNTENKAIRIGINTAKGLLSALEAFLNVITSPRYKNMPLSQVAQELESNSYNGSEIYAYENADQFYNDHVQSGNNVFHAHGIENAQMEKFDQLARQYGLKYYPERKPENLDELIVKQNLTREEKNILLLWTKEISGRRVPIDDDIKITFAEKDIFKMKHIVKDLREYTNLNERLATVEAKNGQDKQQTRTKEKAAVAMEQER